MSLLYSFYIARLQEAMENGFAHTDLDEYDLMLDLQYHGRNIKVEEGGRMARKLKK